MNTPRMLTAALVLFAGAPVLAKVNVGDKAPEIKAAKWYNTQTNVTIEKLRGKVVIVEFWATW